MKDPDFAKQNDRDSAARPLTDIPTKLLKQGFDVPPRQTAACRSGEDQLKGSLVLPLHPSIVLPLGTSPSAEAPELLDTGNTRIRRRRKKSKGRT